jgi:hypothetical protein
MTCTFCSSTAVLVPTDECRVCSTCARRIAKLALRGDADDVWDMRTPPPDAAREEMAARIAKSVSRDDADSHHALAQSFRTMLMYAGALREAALAFEATNDDGRAAVALRIVLTPPLLRADGLAKLRAHLVRMAKN